MIQFETGKIYSCFSPCNFDCRWWYKVVSRTVKTITVVNELGETKRCGIAKRESEINGCECAFPLGRYSLAPMLTAKQI